MGAITRDVTKQERLIELKGKYGEGKFAIVDEVDYKYLSQFNWFVNNSGYAVRSVRKGRGSRNLLMHREILNTPDDKVSDHINGNKLDNRKSNLRIVTQTENTYNTKPRMGTTSKYKGVSWDTRKNMWNVRVWKDGNLVFTEYHCDEKFAAKVYDYVATKTFGEYARVNFPDDILPTYKKRS